MELIFQLIVLSSLSVTILNAFVLNHHSSYVRSVSSSPLSLTKSSLSHDYQSVLIPMIFPKYKRTSSLIRKCTNNDEASSSEPLAAEIVIDDKAYNVFDGLKVKLKGTCIYLVGMMGSGKTSVGGEIAQQLGYRFLDTDSIAEYMIEMPIADFFAQGPEKEQEFRQVEYQVLMELSQYMRVVVSTGGGAVIKNENWGQLRHGLVIFLDLSPEAIYNRLSSNPAEIQKRPLLSQSNPLLKLQEIYNNRIDKYMQADIRIDVNPASSPKQLAVDVAEGVLKFITDNPPMWVNWKKKRDAVAVEAAARMNPGATIKADVGFIPAATAGTVTTVKLSDIQSGKVKLPGSNNSSSGNNDNSSDDEDKKPNNNGPNKGFGKQ